MDQLPDAKRYTVSPRMDLDGYPPIDTPILFSTELAEQAGKDPPEEVSP